MSLKTEASTGLDFYAIRIIPGTKTTYDINDKKGYRNYQSYRELVNHWFSQTDIEPHLRNSIGLPAGKNRLVIIDVDAGGDTHKFDGRTFWQNYCKENSIPQTYTVMTKSGGYHFYFKLPDFYNIEDFHPPGRLANGVDIIYNGYVVAPPSSGYTAYGSIYDIAELPTTLILTMENLKNGGNIVTNGDPMAALENLHTPYTEAQITELRGRLKFFQEHGKLTYQEWRDGLFSLKAGLYDRPHILQEFVYMWTYNQTYNQGDEIKAMEIVDKANEFGGVGPGTIFGLLKGIAIRENAVTVATPHTRFDIIQRAGVRFTSDKDGNLKVEPSESNAANIIKVIYPEDRLYFDVRKNSLVLDKELMPDSKIVNIITPVIQSEAGLGLSKLKQSVISKAVEMIVTERSIDPHKKEISNAKWDGVPRIDTFFEKYCGVEQTEYVRYVSKNFWIALAARGIKPGTQVDFMVVIEGAEGIRKSSLIRAIGGVYTHSNGNPRMMIEEKELAKCHQATLVELPELVGFKGCDSDVIKGFLTQVSDLIRPPYGRRAYDHLRGFNFVGTTNDEKYIPAGVGERRFRPISIPKGAYVNTTMIINDREQLFAEAIYRFQQGEDFWSIPKHLLIPEIQRRKVIDPLENVIKEFIDGSNLAGFGKATTRLIDVYNYVEGRGYIQRGLTNYVYKRLENILTSLGFEEEKGSYGNWVKEEVDSLFDKAVDFSGFI